MQKSVNALFISFSMTSLVFLLLPDNSQEMGKIKLLFMSLSMFPIIVSMFSYVVLQAMNFQGRLKYLHGQNKKGKDGALVPPQLALFTLATPLQSPSILEIRTKNFIFRTKHRLDFTPIGCDAK